jgi:pimeloyl-ACP methyl ester carboxylesterase
MTKLTQWQTALLTYLKTILLALCAVASVYPDPALSQALTFTDDFNRPDSPTVGNGWSDTAGNIGGNLEILNNELTCTAPIGQPGAGIFRPFRFTPPVTVTATVKEMNGFGGLLRRYSAEFWVLNTGVGVESDGYGVVFSRSDALTSNSLVRLFDGTTLVDSASPPFQYGPEIKVSITFNLDGSVMGAVSEPAPSTNTFPFTFGPHTIQSTGSNFSISTGCAGSGDTLFPRFDNVTISADIPPEQKTVLLLHGMNSNAETTWNDFVKEFFNMSCNSIVAGVLHSPSIPNQFGTLCYAINFGQFDKDGPAGLEGIRANGPSSGDYTDFSGKKSLGVEVGEAVKSILGKHPLANIILVGHSRGGLAARSFLQDQDPNISKEKNSIVGLITTGTPHVGSVLGRIYNYLDGHPRPRSPSPDPVLPGPDKDWNVVDFLRGQIICPILIPTSSVSFDFVMNTENQIDVRGPTITYLNPDSVQIAQLILGGRNLPSNIKYGEIRYTGVDLGILQREKHAGVVIEYSVFDKPFLDVCYQLSKKAEKAILINKTPADYIGDGIVPASSQRYGAAKFKATVKNGRVLHTQEPRKTKHISTMFCAMGFPNWLTPCDVP